MRKIAFDEEELLVLAILESDTRKNTIARLEDILPEVKDDPDMEAIVISAALKLKRITDEAFDLLGLEEYRESPKLPGLVPGCGKVGVPWQRV